MLEFPVQSELSLEQQQTVHLDHAASTITPKSVLAKVFEDWQTNLYSNPHSQSNSSQRTTQLIQSVREQILSFFGTTSDFYEVVFTLNATHAMKIVGECFPFTQGSQFIYVNDSAHNSLLGIREYCLEKGGSYKSLSPTQIETLLNENQEHEQYNLFAYAAECNSTGKKYPLEWSSRFQSKTQYVLLDAAKYASTSTLSIGSHGPDFITVSFYKIFGFPSGLGALLVRKDRHILQKKYFSGGTVTVSTSQERYHQFRSTIHETFEDGTIPFLNVIALGVVMKEFPKVFSCNDARECIEKIHTHTIELNKKLRSRLESLRHYNETPLCEIYSPLESSIMNINFLQANGQYIGYSTITKACNLYNINIRTGCFCNPGACSLITTLSSSEQIKNYEQGHVCWDEKDLINGKPTGSVRISFGWSNTEKDLDLFLSMVEENLIMKHDTQKEFFLEKRILTLKQFIIYPIKSCSGISVPSWELSEEGPLFDREWTLVDSNGNYLSQKHYPKMSQIIPSIDLITRTLTISFANEKINLDLDFYPPDLFQDCTVCGTKVVGLVYKDSHITGMLSKFLNVTCHLVRKNPYNDRFARDCDKKINFSNDSQYLLVSQASLDDVNERMKHYDIDHSGCHYQHSDWLVDRFRPNFVIQGEMKPFEEDEFQVLHMGQKEFKITGNCNRCSMICVDQITLRVQNEPLKTLMKYRRRETKILFGVLLAHTNFKKGDRVSVGDVIIN